MKNKRLAILLAAVLTATSADSAAIAVSGADFSSEAVTVEEESQASEDEETPAGDDADQSDGQEEEVDISSDTEGDDVSAETTEDTAAEVGDGSEELFSDEAGEESTSFIPDDTQKLELDKEYTVNVDADHPRGWFSFTPEETGEYIFSSTNNSGLDPLVYLFNKKDATSEWDYLSWADEGKGGTGDFLLKYELEKGVTYYYDARLNDTSDSGSFTVTLTKVKEISSISASGMKTTLIAGFDTLKDMLPDVRFTLQYDGVAKTYEYNSNGYGSVTDDYGHYIFPMLIQDEQKINFDYDSCVDEGTYEYCFSDDDWFDPLFSEAYSVKAIPVTESDSYVGTVKEGENSIQIKSGNIVSFTPAKSGRYSFLSSDSQQMDVTIKSEDRGVYTDASARNGYCSLEAGTTYYIRSNGDDVSGMTIQEVAEMTSAKADASGVKTKFLPYMESCYASGLKITASYSDGTTKTFTFAKEKKIVDDYGNEFSYSFTFGTEGDYYYGEYEPGSMMGENTYNLKVTCNGSQIANIKNYEVGYDPEGAVPQLQMGSNSIESPAEYYNWYWFSPEESGKYSFGPVNFISVKKKADYWSEDAFGIQEGENAIYSLEKGQVYYVGFSGARMEDKIEAWDISIKKAPDVTALTPSEKELTYISGLDDLGAESRMASEVLTVTYGEGDTAETLKVTPYFSQTSIKYGSSVTAQIKDADDNVINWYECEALPVGKYTVTFDCDGIESDPVTVNVKAFDYDSLDKLTEGENKVQVRGESDGAEQYQIVNQDKWYTMVTGDYASWGSVNLNPDGSIPSGKWKKVKEDGTLEDLTIDQEKQYYSLEANSKYVVRWTDDEDGSDDLWLFHVTPGAASDPCQWEEIKRTEPTCTGTGRSIEICRIHGENQTSILKATGHKVTKWTKVSDATISQPQKQQGTCTVCKKKVTRDYGKKLTPTIKLNLSSLTLQKKQSTKAVKVTMAKGDSIKSWSSSNSKVASVDKKGVIKGGSKTGTATITVTLKSGKKATVKVKVQTAKVATTKISGLKSKITLKKGKSTTLKPVISPVTSQYKATYSTSNKSIATVSKNGVIKAGKKKGTAKITVKSGKKSFVVKVTVK